MNGGGTEAEPTIENAGLAATAIPVITDGALTISADARATRASASVAIETLARRDLPLSAARPAASKKAPRLRA